jgi:hypothetical protein
MIQAGKHPGKTNLTDIDNALNILKFLMKHPSAAIMKHNNPSGVARAETIASAYDRANMADRIAAFGGCLAVNRPMDKSTAELVSENYLEVVAAPEYEEGAVDILARRKNLRIVRISRINELEKYMDIPVIEFKALIDGGLIAQQSQINKIRSRDDFQPAKTVYNGKEYEISRMPTEDEYEDMTPENRTESVWLKLQCLRLTRNMLTPSASGDTAFPSRSWNSGLTGKGGTQHRVTRFWKRLRGQRVDSSILSWCQMHSFPSETVWMWG